jgi:hypothetical protein
LKLELFCLQWGDRRKLTVQCNRIRQKLQNLFFKNLKFSRKKLFQISLIKYGLKVSYISSRTYHILFGTELHLKNAYYLYSACSNPTNVVLVIILNLIIDKGLDNGTDEFYRCAISQAITKTITETTSVGFEHAL